MSKSRNEGDGLLYIIKVHAENLYGDTGRTLR